VHEQLRAGRTSTQRDLYYHLVAQQQQQRQQQQGAAAAAAARPLATPSAHHHPHSAALFRSAADVSAALQDAVALLRVPRSSLGVACCGKGAVAGAALSVREAGAGPWLPCGPSAAPSGRALPGGTAAAAAWALRVAPGTAAILVVEKDAVFQRLLQDGLAGAVVGGAGGGRADAPLPQPPPPPPPPLPPVILVTARGFPDVATRCFLRRLVDAAGPGVPVLGLVDWNPAGVAILAAYRFGGAAVAGGAGGGERDDGAAGARRGGASASRTALEAAPYALPELRWLGATAEMLGVGGEGSAEGGSAGSGGWQQGGPRRRAAPLTPLTARDRAMAANLRARLARAAPAWAAELRAMECPVTGGKADIEALYRGAGDAGGGGGGGGGAAAEADEEGAAGGCGGGGGGGGLAADVAERIRWRRWCG
jgi:meiotic recombination protein SPO11